MQTGLIRIGCAVTLLIFAQAVFSFEGDYVWEERFRNSLADAETGDVQAQLAIGDMYLRGRGTQASDTEALHWFLIAARQGSWKAAYKAASLYLYSHEVKQSYSKAIPLLEKSAKSGYAPAQYELGQIYGSGKDGRWNSKKALALLGKAKLAGYQPAYAAFEQVVQNMVKKNIALTRQPKVNKLSEPVISTASKPLSKPKIVRASLRPTLVDSPGLKRTILGNRWDGQYGPSTLLPSNLTNCRDYKKYIECLSSTLTRQVANAEVVYKTRARISHIQKDGSFRLAYTDNVISATNETGARAKQIKTGWQLNERNLDCSVIEKSTINCSKGKSQQYRFTVSSKN